jgi:lipoprotein-releasing system permease protein
MSEENEPHRRLLAPPTVRFENSTYQSFPLQLRATLRVSVLFWSPRRIRKTRLRWQIAAIAVLLAVILAALRNDDVFVRVILVSVCSTLTLAAALDLFFRFSVWVPLVALATSLGALSIILGVIHGRQVQMQEWLAPIQGHAMISVYGGGNFEYREIRQRLATDPQIACALPFVVGQGLASKLHDDEVEHRAVLLKGIELEAAERCPLLMRHFSAAITVLRPAHLQRLPQIALGRGVAARLGLRVGDTVTLASLLPRGRQPSERTLDLRETQAVMGAEISTGIDEWDNHLVLVDLHTGQSLVSGLDRAHGFELEIVGDAIERGLEIAQRWAEILNQGQRVKEFRASSWTDDPEAAAVVGSGKRALMVLALVLFLSCSSTLAAALILTFKVRRRTFGLWLALGLRPSQLAQASLLFGVQAGGIGAAMGVAWGRVVALSIYGEAPIWLQLGITQGLPQALIQPSQELKLVFLCTAVTAAGSWLIARSYIATRQAPIRWFIDA